jgi:glyoxalase family protein
MQLTGLHHLTAVSANASANHAFYTGTLGMRLVKRTVNQDDVSAYHLFYADGLATPGTDVTFFEWPVPQERRGTDSITRTGLRVAGEASLRWWLDRLEEAGVPHGSLVERDGRLTLDFEDPEGQRLALIEDDGAGEAHPWGASPVPSEHQIRGLGPVTLTVAKAESTDPILTRVMNMRLARTYSDAENHAREVRVYEMGPGGPAAELHVIERPDLSRAVQGAGGVHHVAFRTPDDEQYRAWADRLRELRVPSSGPVDRYYFQSLYFREPNGILFEIATDGPGFSADEPLDRLGERLALPPFLEARRASIEAGLKPL